MKRPDNKGPRFIPACLPPMLLTVGRVAKGQKKENRADRTQCPLKLHKLHAINTSFCFMRRTRRGPTANLSTAARRSTTTNNNLLLYLIYFFRVFTNAGCFGDYVPLPCVFNFNYFYIIAASEPCLRSTFYTLVCAMSVILQFHDFQDKIYRVINAGRDETRLQGDMIITSEIIYAPRRKLKKIKVNDV